MEILRDTATASTRFRDISREGKSLGLVPTMGALHEGHLSLVRRAVDENDTVVVSIFVNPVQFEDSEDFQCYPRNHEEDENLLENTGVDVVFYPEARDIYPDHYQYRVTESEQSLTLEGQYRNFFFDGVLTVVLKLINITGAGKAYFGEKDWQQLSLIQGMVNAFFLDTEIVSCRTAREHDGLAMSSRNALLSPEERKLAPEFYHILTGPGSPEVKTACLERFGFAVDYIVELEGRIFGAVHLGKVRLIDNDTI